MQKTLILLILLSVILVAGCVQGTSPLIKPSENGCWFDELNGKTQYLVTSEKGTSKTEYLTSIETVETNAVCPAVYGSGKKCTKANFTVNNVATSEQISNQVLTVPIDQIGISITDSGQKLYLQQIHDEIERVCLNNEKVTVDKLPDKFELEKLGDKSIDVQGQSIECCNMKLNILVPTPVTNYTICVARELCDTGVEMRIDYNTGISSRMLLTEFVN